jgi:hypothetical protein
MSRPPATPESLAAFLEAGWVRAHEAHAGVVQESFLSLADRDVRVRILGRTLADDLLRPFEHLRIDQPISGDLDLSIDVWDADALRSGPPSDLDSDGAPPWRASADGRVVAYRHPDNVAMLDRQARRIVVSFTREPSLTSRGRPFNHPLRLWLADRRVQVLHAGLVARADRGVLFGGAGGSGKSTSTLACLHGGFDYLGDDYVGMAGGAGGPRLGYSIFGSAYLAPDHLRRTFPQIADGISGDLPDEDKVLLLPSPRLSVQVRRRAAICALVLPRPSRLSQTRVSPAEKVDALLSLAPSSVLGAPQTHRDSLDDITALVEAVPCYWLDLGPDPTEIPARVDDILSAPPIG